MTSTATQRVPAVGEIAPDITLASTSGETVSLASLRGRQNVLLAFFPLAFSSICTAEMCAMSEDYDQFTGSDVAVFPVSVDSTLSLKEFKKKEGIKADMLSDFKREASMAYGVLLPEHFFANRAYFLIDKQGIVRWAHVEENPSKRRENAEILREIAKLG